MHREFADVGKTIAFNHWGRDDKDDLHEFIRSMNQDERQTCLLAAIANQLSSLRYELIELRTRPSPRPPKQINPVADGLLKTLRLSRGDIELSECDQSKLSVRSRNILSGGDFTYLSEITEESLRDVRNCGTKTIQEIMEWKNSS
jgi:hypothetical protein